jgi:hypothetical protein
MPDERFSVSTWRIAEAEGGRIFAALHNYALQPRRSWRQFNIWLRLQKFFAAGNKNFLAPNFAR